MVEEWLLTRHDLRATTWARLETTMQKQVLPRFGDAPLRAITNSGVRRWVTDLLTSGLSAATTRKAVFPLRQCIGDAIADNRVPFNPATTIVSGRADRLGWLGRLGWPGGLKVGETPTGPRPIPLTPVRQRQAEPDLRAKGGQGRTPRLGFRTLVRSLRATATQAWVWP